jgi:hypothetical protein
MEWPMKKKSKIWILAEMKYKNSKSPKFLPKEPFSFLGQIFSLMALSEFLTPFAVFV